MAFVRRCATEAAQDVAEIARVSHVIFFEVC
jgi:hypothetical protein